MTVSAIFNPARWREVEGFAFEDITYHRALDQGTVRVAFNRPEVRNAFRPRTVDELYTALDHARTTADIGCVLITGNGPSPKDGGWAFCSGGDQRIRGKDGYKYERADDPASGASDAATKPGTSADATASSTRADTSAEPADPAQAHRDSVAAARARIDAGRLGRLHILEVQRLIRFMPKVVIAVVPGWAAGGGHSLHVVCDLTLASREHARFKQTDPDVASFDSGYGSALLARQVGQKKAREIFFLGFDYTADQAAAMGAINASVPHAELEEEALRWAGIINGKSPTAMRMLKYGFNLPDDGLLGQQLFAGEATRLAYGTDEAQEGRDAFLEKRRPDFEKFPWHY